MLLFSSIPLIFLISGITAAPTVLHPDISPTEPAFQLLTTRATCQEMGVQAKANYDALFQWCKSHGWKLLFKGDCWFIGEPRRCCPEERISDQCKEFWPPNFKMPA
jgi:hypothetical protein